MAAAMLASCGGSQPPIGPPDNLPQGVGSVHAAHSGSWMQPEAKSKDLLYVGTYRGSVLVYAYPEHRLVGELTGFAQPRGECVDAAGDVFIVDYVYSEIVEYAHGQDKPLNTLSAYGYHPLGCSVDPTTGNLAVTDTVGKQVAIYPEAKGTPTHYSVPDFFNLSYCTYDSAGNLFANGDYSNAGIALAELSHGGGSFYDISLPSFGSGTSGPYAIQWDGSYIAFGYFWGDYSAIYQFSVSGSTATIAGITGLTGYRKGFSQFFIDGATAVVPSFFSPSDVRFFSYPGGGRPKSHISFARHVLPLSAAVSPAQE
jgi:hypothetical protein